MFTIWCDVDMPEAIRGQAGDCVWRFAPVEGSLDGLEGAQVAVVGTLFTGSAALFERYPHLLAVGRPGNGYDNIDLEAATAAGVCVLNTPDGNSEATAVFTIGLIINAARRIRQADQHLRAGGGLGARHLQGMDLNGRVLGIVGLGRIGSRVAEIAHTLGLRVLAYDPYIEEGYATARRVTLMETLPELLAAADIVTLHVPLTPETRGMMNAATFAQMKPGALLVNAARGPVVVEADLADALTSGHLGGAALDVWDPEPPRPDNPLLAMDNLLATPHIAASADQGRERSRRSLARQIGMLQRGEQPYGLVNKAVWPTRRG